MSVWRVELVRGQLRATLRCSFVSNVHPRGVGNERKRSQSLPNAWKRFGALPKAPPHVMFFRTSEFGTKSGAAESLGPVHGVERRGISRALASVRRRKDAKLAK